MYLGNIYAKNETLAIPQKNKTVIVSAVLKI